MIEIKPIEQDDIPGALASERELRRQEPDETSRANGRIKTERLTLRRVRAADRVDIRAIWADAARSVYAQYDRPNDLDEPAVSAGSSAGPPLPTAANTSSLPSVCRNGSSATLGFTHGRRAMSSVTASIPITTAGAMPERASLQSWRSCGKRALPA